MKALATPLKLGTETKYGKIGAILSNGGERYYLCHYRNSVAMVPYFILEESDEERTIRRLRKKLTHKTTKIKGLTKKVSRLEKKCRTARLLFVGI